MRRSIGRLPTVSEMPAVLGKAVLGDVHVGHDLEPGGHRRGDGPGRGGDVVEDAVDPVADPQVLAGGLDVDVRGPLVERLEDEEVDVADDGGVVDDRLEVAELLVGRCRRSPRPPAVATSLASPPWW